jgi:hypothetical protein
MKTIYLLLMATLAFTLMSCSKSTYAPASVSPAFGYMPEDDFYNNSRGGYSESGIIDKMIEEPERKVLYDAYITLSAKDTELAAKQVEEIAKKYEGYVLQSGTYATTIRVKSDKLKLAIADIEILGKVQNQSISGQDVTEQYLDYGIRLENAEKARLRYLELLEKAENVEAALLCEKELERLNETIETLKGKMNRIDHLVEFSTITVTIKEKKKPGLIGYVGMGLYYSVKWLFVRN